MFILIVIVISIVAILASLFIKSSFEISESLVMNVSKEKIFKTVLDFKSWQDWSPWILHEKDVNLKYSDKVDEEGGNYSWNGKKIGSGTMTHNAITKNEKIEQTVTFLKPYKSTSKVTWLFESQGKKTNVTWEMKGSMPFLFKAMIGSLKDSISKDYKLGLILMNQLLDNSVDKMEIDFIGQEILGKDAVLYKSFEGTLEEMKRAMEETFPALDKYCSENEVEVVSQPMAIYHKVKPLVKMDIGIPIKKKKIKKNEIFQVKKLPATKYFRMDLKGKYDFLEQAWHIAFSHIRVNKMKFKFTKSCLEIYLNQSENKNDLRTSIYIPIK